MSLPESSASPVRCPNCQAIASGVHCSMCGQRLDVDPKSVRAWIRELLDETLSINGRLPRSMKALLFHPGLLTDEWRAGRRAAWTHPLRLYLLSSFLFLAAVVLTPAGDSVTVGFTEGASDASGVVQAAPTAQGTPIQSATLQSVSQDRMSGGLRANYPYAMFVLVPLFALLLGLLYRGRGTVYVGHLVHALHIHAAFFVFLAAIGLFDDLPDPWADIVQIPILVWALVYPVLSARRVYATSWIGSSLRTLVILPVYLLAVLVGLGAVVGFSGAGTSATDTAEKAYWDARDLIAKGDSAGASEALPGVVEHYLRLEYALYDDHLRSHLADTYLLSGAAEDALLEAERILVERPNHLLALSVAARSAADLGDETRSADLWRRFVQAYGVEGALDGFEDSHRLDLIRDAQSAAAALARRTEPDAGN